MSGIKKLDNYDKSSILVGLVGFILYFLVIYVLPEVSNTFLNRVGIIGSLASTIGVIVAVIQIFKIKNSNSTFLKTLKVVENNSIIEVISRSIEQIRLIKVYFDQNIAQDARSNFNILRYDLNEITYNEKAKGFQDKLAEYTEFCSLMETHLFDGSLPLTKTSLSDKYSKLTELETLLQELKSIVKRPEKDNV